MNAPLIGITADNRDNTADSGQYEIATAYANAVADAGGVPVILPHQPDLAEDYVQRMAGLVLTGGVDPDTESFGESLHPRARPMDPTRQAFELALIRAAHQRDDRPVLGVCLGMQLMALDAGGRLDQYLPDTLANPGHHADDTRHGLVPGHRLPTWWPEKTGEVVSSHQQAVADPGELNVIARAADDVIEAVNDPDHPFYVGVQWHPERGGEGPVNRGLFRALVNAARSTS
ncbi:MAG: gamma-glutamyl-gamma-aminobutyrate hydrolase family protein [Phycisphaeraceae bacterium]|nr:gamma-glutamyl-gamma-aminobutyrate hydrolase family protein [Phycisphaeraceae bacterium]